MNVQSPDFYLDMQGLGELKNAARSDGKDPETLRQVAAQFESLYMNMVLKSMREATPGDGLFESDQTRFFRDMYDQQLSVKLSEGGGMGLTDLLVRQLGGEQQGNQMAAVTAQMQPDPESTQAPLRRSLHGYAGIPLNNAAEGQGISLSGGFLPLDESRVDSRWLQAPRASSVPQIPDVDAPELPAVSTPPTAAVVPLVPDLPVKPATAAAPFSMEIELELEPVFERPAVAPVAPVEAAKPAATVAVESPVAPAATTREHRGPWLSPSEFVRDIWPHAERAAEKLGVSPRAIVAQSALETGWGRKLPLREDGSVSFNLFGIKADQRWDGERVRVDTLEFENQQFVSRREPFRAYDNLAQAVDDYANFLDGNPRYQEALAAGYDESAFAAALQSAGYATDPAYARKIGRIAAGETLASALAEGGVVLKGGFGKPTSS